MAFSDEILDRLLLLHPKLIDLSLDRIFRLLSRLGDPHASLDGVIHIAGTNGKGSVVAYLCRILEDSGYRVHSYISPHLVRFHERIRLAGLHGARLIEEEDLIALLEECERLNGGEEITFFEITTAAAFLAFSRYFSDFQILETGLGGRLDATNVVSHPLVSIITSIDYDHEQFLGDSLSEIASEKAGILKPGSPGVIGVRGCEARRVIRAKGEEIGCRMYFIDEDWHVYRDGERLIYEDGACCFDLPLPSLLGDFQILNAGISIAALRVLEMEGRIDISSTLLAHGLERTRWRGRMERLGEGFLHNFIHSDTHLWLDGGHNGSAGLALSDSFRRLFQDEESASLDIICGMLNSKNVGVFLRSFKGLVRHVTAIEIPGEENSHSAETIRDAARALSIDCDIAPDIEHALRMRSSTSPPPSHILICGSLYLVGSVLSVHEGRGYGGGSNRN